MYRKRCDDNISSTSMTSKNSMNHFEVYRSFLCFGVYAFSNKLLCDYYDYQISKCAAVVHV